MFLLFSPRASDLKKQRSNYSLLIQSILFDIKIMSLTRCVLRSRVEI